MTTVKAAAADGGAAVMAAGEPIAAAQMSLEDAVSSIRFLLNMSHNFEQQDNLPESVKSAESALILRQAHDAAITAALESGQLSQDDRALLPRRISEQAKALVLRCNNYAVREFTARRFDAATFFLNKALFLTDDGYEHTSHTAAGTTFLPPPTLSLVAAGTIASATTPLAGDAARRTPKRASSSSNTNNNNTATRNNEGSAGKKAKAGSRSTTSKAGTREKKKTATPKTRTAGQRQRTETEGAANSATTPPSPSVTTHAALMPEANNEASPQGWVAACFANAEDERLALRAATYNNLGCMERRRGQPRAALEYLRKAALLEQRVDQTGAGCAATYLNLCTVQNAVLNFDEAVIAAERAVAALQLLLLEQPLAPARTDVNSGGGSCGGGGADPGARMRYVTMLIVAQYNLGVSLEHRGRVGDDNLAKAAYRRVGELSRGVAQNSESSTSNKSGEGGDLFATVEAALQAVRRIEAAQVNGEQPVQAQEEAERQESEKAATEATAANEVAAAACETSDTTAEAAAAASADTRKAKIAGELGFAAAPAALPPMSQLPKLPSTVSSSSSAAGAAGAAAAAAPSHTATSTSTTTRSSMSLPVCSVTRATTAVHHSSEPEVHALRVGHAPPITSAVQETPQRVASPPSKGSLSQATNNNHNNNYNNNNNNVVITSSRSMSSVKANSLPARLPALPPPPPQLTTPGTAMSNTAPPPPLLPNALNTPDTNMTIAQPDARGGTAACQMCNASLSGPLQMLSISSSHSLPPLPNAIPAPPSLSQRSSMSERLSRLSIAAAQQRRNSRQNQSVGGSQSFLLGLQPEANNTNSAKTRQLQDKVRLDIQRRQAAEQARAEAELADTIYEQLVKGMREQTRQRCAKAAVQIQRIWRGVMTRTWLRQLLHAARTIQRYVRTDFLVRLRERQREAARAAAAARAAQEVRETQACRVIQRRVRQFLRRLAIRRAYVARVRREFFAARCIQRGYRAARARRTARLLALAEQHRREDALTALRESIAARRIAQAYRAHRRRRAIVAAAEAERRRVCAAIRLQSFFRGVLTRAWFVYYKVQCRTEQVRSAACQRSLTVVQAMARATLAMRLHTQKQARLVEACRRRLQTRAAVRLQCLWRRHVARIRYERLCVEHACRVRHALRIQCWYRCLRARRALAAAKLARRQDEAAVRIQRWLHACRERRKARDFARYHVNLLRRQRLQRMQAKAVVQLQGLCRARLSALLVCSMRSARARQAAVARVLQPIARGYAGRRSVAQTAHFLHVVALREEEERRRGGAAAVVQRAWRAACARAALEQRRRAALAATRIAACYRMYRAKQARRARQAALRTHAEDCAARVLQRGLRAALRRRRVAETAAYYAAQHRKALGHRRRVEACTAIQALWRGHVTRRVMREYMAEMRVLTGHVVAMQRRWRARCNRDALRNEISRRVACRGQRRAAALTLQCFWRKMCAAERVARRRAEVAREQHAALQLQCWWRRLRAQRERRALQRAQAESDALAAVYLELWHKAVTRVNAFLRARQSALHVRDDLYRSALLVQLSAQEQRYYNGRHAAATVLQAHYRGHLTRRCIAKAKAQAAAAAVVASEAAQRRAQRAARRIQCALRQHLARATLARLRAAQTAELNTTVVEVDPHYAVRTAFLQYNTIHHRNVTAEREARDRRLHAAAATVQRAYRARRARRAALAELRRRRQAQAAWCILRFWRSACAARAEREAGRRAAAAVTLQRLVRGWRARRQWRAARVAALRARQAEATAAAAKDRAAIVIECAWRRRCATREAARRRAEAARERRLRTCHEAVALIEEAYLAMRQRRRAKCARDGDAEGGEEGDEEEVADAQAQQSIAV